MANLDRPIENPALQAEQPAEDVLVPGAMTGAAIVDDICNRIAEQLSKNCDLRETDSYSRYSAKAIIAIQLTDLTSTNIVANVNVGTIDEAQPTTYMDVIAEVEAEAPEASLEVNTDGSPVEPAPAAALKQRYYTPRGQKPVPL